MYRLSRTFLLRANEYNNIHNYVRATPRQCFSEFVKAKEHTQENNAPEKHDDTEDNNNNTNKITVQTLHKIISNSEPPVERILDKELISKSNGMFISFLKNQVLEFLYKIKIFVKHFLI